MEDSSDVTLVQSDTSPVCKHFQTGFCKFADKCKRRHEKEMCPLTQCSSKTCRKRHPKLCKFFSLRGFCKFGDLCCYKHLNAESQKTPHLISALQTKVDEMEQLIKTLQSEIVALKNINKCEVCDYVASSSTTLKAHISKKHKHTSEAAPLERERSQLIDTSLNASLPSEERLENTQLIDIASDDFKDDPTENEAPTLVHCEHTYFNSFTGLLEPVPCPLHPCCAMCEITAASEESRPPRFCNFQSDSSCPRPCSGAIFDVDISHLRGHGDWEVFNFIVGAPSLIEFRL